MYIDYNKENSIKERRRADIVLSDLFFRRCNEKHVRMHFQYVHCIILFTFHRNTYFLKFAR